MESGTGLSYEDYYWDCGFHLVAGIDEAGRGALAGPLVAGAVLISRECVVDRGVRETLLDCIRDSKRLSHVRRSEAHELILECFLAVGTGVVDAADIDLHGLSAANRMAMERAVIELTPGPEVLLIDALTIESSQPQIGLIDGDDRVLSISAASIVAKVTRDAIMDGLELSCPGFTFSSHRGYGTKRHLEELQECGPSHVHRRSFAPVRQVCGSS